MKWIGKFYSGVFKGPIMENWWDWDASDAPEPYLPREWLDPEQWGERESGTGGFGDD
jgi:hypothetical protein